MIEVDVETTGLQWYANDLFLTQFLDNFPPEAIPHPGNELEVQNRLSQDADYRAWNAKFDLHFLDAAGYSLPAEHRWHDGMVMAHIVDERRSPALFAVADRLQVEYDGRFQERAIKEWLKEERKRRRDHSKDTGDRFVFPNYSDVPGEIMHPYATGDVLVQREVCQILEAAMPPGSDLREVYELERGVLAALFHVEKRGLPIDRAAAAAFEASVYPQLEASLERCKALAGIDTFNPGAPAQVEEALKRRGADLTFVSPTPSGALSMDADNLATVNDELAQAVLEFRGLSKTLSTYLRPMLHETVDKTYGPRAPFLGPDDRIHPNFRQVGARTARMSASDPNVQNWMRDDLRLRYLARADEGNKLVCVDLEGIELRLFAGFCGDGPLLQAIKSGADMHTMVADDVGLEDFDRGGGIFENRRQRGKKFNYSIIYGAGMRSIRKAFHAKQDRAREMIQAYHAAYPEVGELQRRIEFKLVDQGYIRTPWGRHHRVEGKGYRAAEREAYKFTNYLVQGTAADLIKDALVKIHKAGVPVVNVVHDEIVAEVPEADAEEAGRIIVEAMTEFGEDEPGGKILRAVPLEAEAQIVDRWSEAKDPAFKPDYLKGSP